VLVKSIHGKVDRLDCFKRWDDFRKRTDVLEDFLNFIESEKNWLP